MTDTRTRSAIPLPHDAGGPMPTPAEDITEHLPPVSRYGSGSETYATLVWRRFRRSPMGMIGLILVALMLLVSIFADFFAPMDPKQATCLSRHPTSLPSKTRRAISASFPGSIPSATLASSTRSRSSP